HRVGDEVLAQIASRVRATVRGNDPIGRLGSDEIAVLLVGAGADQAIAVVHKLIDKVRAEPIEVESIALSVQVRATATELAPGERSGEAALARCYGALRSVAASAVVVVASDARAAESEPGADTGGLSTGTIVGGTYRVVHELSRGAMGVVY